MQQAQVTLAGAQKDIDIANTYMSEWNASVQALSAEIQGFASEVGARNQFIAAATAKSLGHQARGIAAVEPPSTGIVIPVI